MKKHSFLVAVLVMASALPMFGQSTEFGVLVGGSRRSIEDATPADDTDLKDDDFSFSNNSFDLYWAMETEPDVYLKFKVGRIKSPVAFEIIENDQKRRLDVDGEVQHAEANVEYRFSEPYGSTGLFAGVGFYRTVAADVDTRFESQVDTRNAFGFNGGVSADFPLSRRYGVIVEAAYHWTQGSYRSRYLTLSGGLRLGF